MPSKYENPKVNTEGKLGAKKLPEQIKGKAKEVNKKSAKSLLGLRIGLGLKNLFSKKDKDIPVAIPKVKGIDRPGQSILKDGSVQFADGSIKHPDGSTDFPDGRKEL